MDAHIIYRSKSEAIADDFWYSEGWLTATKAGDGILFGIIAVPTIILIVWAWDKLFNRR